ncbi:hypothetical protein H0H93_013303 [Arthromyces matolae]|nr:hypothetical protein H0H93_013303 [Arthromyces matolae]
MDFESPSSPTPSTSSITTSNPRKRPRNEASSEERKEARAHRNRIAAQNSRDRRKAQFSYLERRVAELEEENRSLRASRGVPLLPVTASTAYRAEEEHKRLEANARERENEELRERIKTLERGWDAVLKALAAQGLPLAQPPTNVSPNPVFPISPAPSHSSLEFSVSTPSSSIISLDTPEPTSTNSTETTTTTTETTRHSARVASMAGGLSNVNVNVSGPLSIDLDLLFSQPSSSTQTNEPDDATMETLFMEILASPLPADSTPSCPSIAATQIAQTATTGKSKVAGEEEIASTSSVEGLGLGLELEMNGAGATTTTTTTTTTSEIDLGLGLMNDVDGWDSGLEMQRILASLGVVTEDDQPQTAELELGLGWATELGVGVF